MHRRNLLIVPIIAILVFSLTSVGLASAGETGSFIVTSSANGGPGTLLQALLDAKSGDRIQFSPDIFPKRAPATITLLSELPELAAGRITIDASDAGVILDGSLLQGNAYGLRIVSDGNVIYGLQVINFPADGIAIWDNASMNTIGGAGKGQGNTIGGNGKSGIFILGAGSDNNRIIGNHIGLDASGTAALPNHMHGINLMNQALGTIIGGSLPGEGNLIGGNLSAGILIEQVADTVIQGNTIGLDHGLRQTIGNATCGIVIVASSGTLVGGEGEKYANIIAGNLIGIDIWAGASHNVITGNLIGYRAFSGNSDIGVHLYDGASDNVIGPHNTIAYNGKAGIQIDEENALRNTVTANSIFQNNGNAFVYNGGAGQDMATLSMQVVTSHSVSGTALPGVRVEVFSDLAREARYFEGSTTANEQGNFFLMLPSGSFQGRTLTALAIDTLGNSTVFIEAQTNPGFGVIKALPEIPSPEQVSTDPVVVGTNLVVALVSIVFFGFTTTVFNSVVKKFQPSIKGAWEKIVPVKARGLLVKIKQAELDAQAPSRWRFLALWFAIVGINAIVESFLDPGIAFFDTTRLRSIAGLLAAGLVISGLEWGSDLWVHRRLCDQPHARGELRWFGLLAALASMLFSRAVHFTPGYILGTMGTIILVPRLCDREQAGKRAGIVLASIFSGGLILWFGSSFLPPALGWMEALFLNIFAISLQGVLFELIPLDVFDGSDLWKWKKGIWFLLFLAVFFGFTHIFLNPSGQDVQALQQNGIRTLLFMMAIYGLATFGLWIAFRRTNRAGKRAS